MQCTLLGSSVLSARYAPVILAHFLVLDGDTRTVVMIRSGASAAALAAIARVIRRGSRGPLPPGSFPHLHGDPG